MSLDQATRDRIASLIASKEVMLFMKGSPEAPQCGFSARVVGILDRLIPDYGTFDVLSDQAIREGVKEYSSWPTIPQLYVRGEFVGGCDIIEEGFGSGELHEALGVERGCAKAPAVTLTPAAAEALQQATSQATQDQRLILMVDARYRSRLVLGPPEPGALRAEAEGIELWMDPLSAQRAEGIRIDLVRSGQGAAFQVRLPNAPNAVQAMTVRDLKQRLDAGEPFELLDVRTPEERATAHIEGSTLIDPAQARRLEGLPRDTMLVFHCHHGGRSQAAAEHFAGLGFTNVHNVVGGIDAWSLEIDPSVPRY